MRTRSLSRVAQEKMQLDADYQFLNIKVEQDSPIEELEAAPTTIAEEALLLEEEVGAASEELELEFELEPEPAEPEPEQGVEAELTSLSWLQSLDITSASSLPTPPCSPPPPPPPKPAPKKTSPVLKAQLDYALNSERYRTDILSKPPYSYATLICLAMQANGNKLTLSSIYAWIKENFAYYTVANPAWKNSIRHNLSLNKCFVKLPRTKGQPGKGGFWKLDFERLEGGRRTRRRNKSSSGTNNANSGNSSRKRKSSSSGPGTSRYSSSQASSHQQFDDLGMVDETSAAIASILRNETNGPKVQVLYETPPSSVSPPIPESLADMAEPTQVSLTEDDLTGLLIDTVGWDENQLDLLDSLLDTL